MDKAEQILQLLAEKTSALHEELSSLADRNNSLDDDYASNIISQIGILNEVYNEVKLISKQDD